MSILGKNFARTVGMEDRSTEPGRPEDTAGLSLDVEVAETRAQTAEDEVRRTAELAELDETEDAIERGFEVAEALENFRVDLAGKVQTGGLDKTAAGYASDLACALESLVGHRGYTAAPTIAVENFNGASSNKQATQVSMEGVGDSLAKLWEWIKEKYKQFTGWIKKHYLKWFGDYENLKKRADAMKEKAKDIKGTMSEQEIENTTLASNFTVGGSVADVNGIRGGLKASLGAMTALAEVTSRTKNVNTILEEVASSAGDWADVSDKGNKLATAMGAVADSSVALVPGTGDAGKYNLSGENIKVSGVLPGEYAIIVSPYGTSTKPLDVVIDMTVKFSKLSLKNAASDVRLKTLKQNEIMDICNSVIEAADAGVRSRKLMEDAVKDAERTEKALNNFSKTALAANDDRDADAEKKAKSASFHNKLPKAVLIWASLPMNLSKDVLAYGLKLGKASLDYCQASMGQYKVED